MKKTLLAGLATGLLMFGITGVASANFLIDFEGGTDGARVDDIAGVSFLNFNNFAPVYLDGSSGNYNIKDENGTYDYGDYAVNGNFGMYAGPEANAQGVKVDFDNNDGTWRLGPPKR